MYTKNVFKNGNMSINLCGNMSRKLSGNMSRPGSGIEKNV